MQLLARTPRLLMDNVYQSPSLTPPPSGVDGAKFDLDRALNLGWQSFKGQIGLGVAYTIVLALLSVLAVLHVLAFCLHCLTWPLLRRSWDC